MPNFFKDGSIVSSNIMLFKKSGYWISKFTDYGIVKAKVDEVLYTDDPRNSTYNTNFKQVQYICTILGGINAGQRVFNVSSIVPLGGVYNSGEVIHTPNAADDNSGKTKKSPDKTQGEVVLISFLHGSPEAPVIIGSLKHPESEYAATIADGKRIIYEFNGIKVEINKDGELEILFGGGPKNSQGQPIDQTAAGSKILFGKDGKVTIQDADGTGIVIDKQNKKLELNGGTGGVELGTGGSWNVNVSGNVSIEAGGSCDINGALVNIGGGGMQAARMNDQVFGVDGEGRPINAYIGIGSSTVLIGG